MKFWDAVNSRRANGDSIRRVVFDFPDPSRVKNIPATEELTKQMAILHAFSASMHAAKGITYKCQKIAQPPAFRLVLYS